MKTETHLNMPLSDLELDELETLLASDIVPEDCMNLEMLDGFLTACVCPPVPPAPSEWLPVVWGNVPNEKPTQANVIFSSSKQAQRLLELIFRHWATIGDILGNMPTLYRPMIFLPADDVPEPEVDGMDYEAHSWCAGFMIGVSMCEDQWSPLLADEEASDWLFPVNVLAFGDEDPDYAKWVDDDEERSMLIDELAIAVVLMYRFFSERREKQAEARGGTRRNAKASFVKKNERLH